MPRPGGACSSYLIRTHDAAVLLDLGPGAYGKLQLVIDYPHVDAIVISHMHSDHFFDLVPFRYALKYGRLRRDRRLPLWLPPGGVDALETLRRAVAVDVSVDFFDGVFDVREYDPGRVLHVNDMRLRFAATRHYVEAYAIRAETDATSLTYSADTAPCEAVVELARETSLFLCETALGLHSEKGERGHSSAQEAGAMACEARAGRLVLTHYSAEYSTMALVEAAQREFSGTIEAADDGMEVRILSRA
jgi:ribonuclease BN (tRNA processing enzyme)